MGRAIFGLLLGFAVVFGVALWARTCLPDPHDKGIEWLHREDVIVVQMKTVGGDNPDAIPAELRPPSFTLYGDGKILVIGGCGDKADACYNLVEGRLDVGQTRDLLTFLDKKGFFDFAFAQPQPPVSGAPTTFVFAGTMSKQNAVMANALGWQSSGSGWEDFRALQRIVERLSSVRAGVVEDGAPYHPKQIVLLVRDASIADTAEAQSWPVPGMNLALIASNPTGLTLEDGPAKIIQFLFPELSPGPADLGTYGEDGHQYDVLSRPVLPYEENFPEFEPPTQ